MGSTGQCGGEWNSASPRFKEWDSTWPVRNAKGSTAVPLAAAQKRQQKVGMPVSAAGPGVAGAATVAALTVAAQAAAAAQHVARVGAPPPPAAMRTPSVSGSQPPLTARSSAPVPDLAPTQLAAGSANSAHQASPQHRMPTPAWGTSGIRSWGHATPMVSSAGSLCGASGTPTMCAAPSPARWPSPNAGSHGPLRPYSQSPPPPPLPPPPAIPGAQPFGSQPGGCCSPDIVSPQPASVCMPQSAVWVSPMASPRGRASDAHVAHQRGRPFPVGGPTSGSAVPRSPTPGHAMLFGATRNSLGGAASPPHWQRGPANAAI